ncbi:MAG: phenylacetate-CoA oxygenase subunit PaaC [Flavobacteriales bacterium]|nr:phenylacetate-CoA oxygenase subunit PaaC [Flavobacteriales bacterium]MCB9449281.1 phenylacetate-CoA oxygenase subunit PaaC [Flavobacteriales bacterium]
MDTQQALFTYCLRLADNSLVLGNRLSEWCGHAPILEEDLALANIALDKIGQARTLFQYAGEVEGKGRSEDDLAYRRSEREFFNTLLAELPKGDFAFTIVRQLLNDTFDQLLYRALSNSKDETLKAFAVKSLKEVDYHVRHINQWMLRLGDGTEESHRRVQQALDDLWPYSGELFEMDEVDRIMISEGIGVDLNELRAPWNKAIQDILTEATLTQPEDGWMHTGGKREGRHSEHLGFMLAEMQFLPRAYPDAKW